MNRARSIFSGAFTFLLALVLAVVIWINAVQAEDPVVRRTIQLPVTYIGLPDNVVMLQPANPNQTVLVAYEGRTSVVSDLSVDDFAAIVDLTDVPYGTPQTVPINVQTDQSDITLDPPAPDQLEVVLEQKVSRDIPVQVDIRGSTARGHTRDEELIDPEFIAVTGIQSEVDALDFAQVTVFLNDEKQTIVATKQPIFYDRQGRVASTRNLDLSVDEVEVTMPIRESADFTEKIITVDVVGEPAPGYRLLSASVEPPSVLVTGRPSLLQIPFNVKTEPIDITGLTESFQSQVALVLPNSIEIDTGQEFTATVRIEPFRSTKIFNELIEVQGLDEDMEAILDPESVRVVLFGPSPVLEALLDEEIRVTVDVFGLEVGIYGLEPTVDFPDRGLELRSIQPSLVSVEITRSLTTTEEITGTLPLTDTSSMRYNAPAASGASNENVFSIAHCVSMDCDTDHHTPYVNYPQFFNSQMPSVCSLSRYAIIIKKSCSFTT